MAQEIIALPIKVPGYLIKTGDGFLLIDTGDASDRARLDASLQEAGAQPGNLKLVLITHADVDHIGNVAFLRQKYDAKIAAHPAEAEAISCGDAGRSRKSRPDRIPGVMLAMIAIFSFFERFRSPAAARQPAPEVLLEDGFDLSPYGVDARVLHLPGHTRGSIGVLTPSGDLYCGDLLMNFTRPALHFIIDDLPAARASLQRLRDLGVKMGYPGHGKPFPLSAIKD